jgi:hypothetical protein
VKRIKLYCPTTINTPSYFNPLDAFYEHKARELFKMDYVEVFLI